jgi:hypothetical protein
MPDFQITPDQTIEIAGHTYTLDGSFKTLKDIQTATKTEIIKYINGLWESPFEQMAKVIDIGIRNAQQNPPLLPTIEQAIVEEIGIIQAREKLMTWLGLAVTPKAEREKKAKRLAEKRAELEAKREKLLSLGETTSE